MLYWDNAGADLNDLCILRHFARLSMRLRRRDYQIYVTELRGRDSKDVFALLCGQVSESAVPLKILQSKTLLEETCRKPRRTFRQRRCKHRGTFPGD